MSFNNSVILCGGKGERMKPITNHIPKALVEIGGKSLIDHVFKMIGDAKKYVTYGHKSDALFDSTNSVVDGYINTTNKGNSYFIYNSFIKYINEPIIVSPCDMVMDIDLHSVYEDYINLESPPIMVVGVEPVDGVAGDFIEQDDTNTIIKLGRDNATDKYCSGLQIINPYRVNEITKERNNFYDVWEQLRHKRQLKVSNVSPRKWNSYDDIKSIT
jgi:NDP-sugar pyrophosphorylase family protein